MNISRGSACALCGHETLVMETKSQRAIYCPRCDSYRVNGEILKGRPSGDDLYSIGKYIDQSARQI